MSTPQSKLAVSVQEAAELLGLHPATVYRMCYERRMPHKKISTSRSRGRAQKIIIPVAALERWLNDDKKGGGKNA